MAGRKPRTAVIVVAAGKGSRFGRATPKQLVRLAGKPMLLWSLELFSSLKEVDDIVVVVPSRFIRRVERMIRKGLIPKISAVVPGGRLRQHSVMNGLRSVRETPERVLVHDAARPLITAKFVRGLIAAARTYPALVPVLPVADTIKKVGRGNTIAGTVDRRELRFAQTPQVFRFDLLNRAHVKAAKERFIGTDDASLIEHLGLPVHAVPGLAANLKITVRSDLQIAEMQLRNAK